MKENELKMSCSGYKNNDAGIFSALFAVLQWTFCEIFDTPHEKRWAVTECIAHTCWANETPFGDEMSIHDKATREARKILTPISPEMSNAIEALACIVQILNRQEKISVESTITDKTAVLKISCDTKELHPRDRIIKVLDKETLCITLEGKKE